MSRTRQISLITLAAVAGFFGLRALPDTHCAFLHNDHQPVIANGVEFCGVNEEANYYSPKALQFPVELEMELSPDGTGFLRLKDEDHRPILDHQVAVSHTRKVHLHLRQLTGRSGYVHVHPVAQEDGRWTFSLPADYLAGNPGGDFQAFVDFVPQRRGRVMLAEASVTCAFRPTPGQPSAPRIRITHFSQSTEQAGKSALVRVTLDGPADAPLKLQPLMGSLGHAVVMGDPRANPGYAHMHPSLEGGEYEASPTLSFRLRLPAPGEYDFWLNINDGTDQYVRHTLRVTP